VIDVNNFPLEAIEQMTLATRKIGLGVMGLADLLFEMRLPYNSDEGRKFMEKLMEFINYHSKIASIDLAKERGPLPYYDKSFYPEGKLPFAGFHDKKSWHFEWEKVVEMIKESGIRNGYTTVIAPTGSISMIAGCSSGIEPVYSLVFEKNVKVGNFYYIDSVFERMMTEEGLFGDDLLSDVNDHVGSIQRISYIPDDLKLVYVTAMDIRPEDHIRALAAFQRWTDSSISKTNNFPANATIEDMRESYLLAYKLGCKDVTVFRDTSIQGQVLVVPRKKQDKKAQHHDPVDEQNPRPQQLLTVPLIAVSQGRSELIRLCPQCQTSVVYQEGCYICPECGWGACS
jgi:ribonucleoside-diphosphate reductase alpha chain